MTTLREEIDPYCASEADREKILKIIEKRIDSTIPNQSTTTGYLWAIGFNDALRQVKEMLSK